MVCSQTSLNRWQTWSASSNSRIRQGRQWQPRACHFGELRLWAREDADRRSQKHAHESDPLHVQPDAGGRPASHHGGASADLDCDRPKSAC